MPSLVNTIRFILEGGRVVRYHTRPGIKPDTDAQHSHGVAMLCYLLYPDRQPSSRLLMAALTHDLAEQSASDVSAHTKRKLGLSSGLQQLENETLGRYELHFELTEEEEHILSIADKLECLLNCCYERSLGNLNTILIWERQCRHLETLLQESDVEVFRAIKTIWEETNVGIQFECLSE